MIDWKNKTILISGATGSWGNEIITQLLKKEIKEIRSFARGELAQVQVQRKFNDNRIKIYLGDVRDFSAVNAACKNVDIVIHLAAQKHVPLSENQPDEAIKTNIHGTQNVIRAAIENKVKIVVESSTDKVCSPHTMYGLTKGIAEMLILHANKVQTDTKFICIRSGNVMGSNGSVITLWISQIKTKNEVTITSPEMTRFFLTIPEAIQLLLTAVESELYGGLFVLNMPSCKMIDLAQVLIDWYGNKETKIIETGIRQAEKLHESLISPCESISTYIYDDNYYVYFSDYRKSDLPKVPFTEFNSNTKLMNKEQIKVMLMKGGFLI